MPADPIADVLAGDRGGHILVRMTAIVAGDVERSVGMGTGDLSERANEIDHMAAVEDRPDEEHAGLASAIRGGVPVRDARWNHAHALEWNLEVLDDLAPRKF